MATVSNSLVLHDKASQTIIKTERATANLNNTLAVTDRATQQIDLEAIFNTRVTGAINQTASAVENFEEQQNNAKKSAEGIDAAWNKIKATIIAAGLAIGAKEIIELADAYTQTTARLNLMNDGLQTTAELQDKIMASANRSRADYQTTADIVSKLGMQARDAFSSNDELIMFVEQLNKSFVVAGTSATGVESTMYNLTQALASGVLRGQDLKAVMDNAMPIVQNIADYMGLSVGEIRAMAEEGRISADVVKNAMLAAAQDTNATFAEMPMTFGQLMTIAGNNILQAFQPVIEQIAQGAQWIYDNWSRISPVVYGLAAAIGVLVAAFLIWKAVTIAQTIAQWALNAAVLANPITWVIIAIAAVIGIIVALINKMGGLRIAWLVVSNALITSWDWIKIAFFTGVYWVLDLVNKLQLAWKKAGTAIANFMGDMKADVLMLLQNMINGAIDILNKFIGVLNKVPGVNIDYIGHVTFGTSAALENEAAKQARNKELADYEKQINSQIEARDKAIESMKFEARAATAMREAEIELARAAKEQEAAEANAEPVYEYTPYDMLDGIDVGTVEEVNAVNDDINIAEEDLKFLRDVAEMRYVQNFVTLTPTVSVAIDNVNENADIDSLIDQIEAKLEDEFVMAAEGVYN